MNVGAMAFRVQSVIDYAIAACQDSPFIAKFEIIDWDSLSSDGHSLLSTSFKFHDVLINEIIIIIPQYENIGQNHRWTKGLILLRI